MKIATYVILAFTVALTGCMTTTYKEASSSKAHAVIEGGLIENKTATLLLGQKAAYILEINDLPVDNFWKGYGAKRKIEPGETKVLLEAGLKGEMTAYTVVTFTAEESKHYYANYEVDGMNVRLFVTEKESGDVVGEAMTSKVRRNVSTPIFIPIVY